MKQTKRFPKVLVSEYETGFEGLAGLRLKSILKGDLLVRESLFGEEKAPHLNPLDPKRQQAIREDFLNAVSSWPKSLPLELHMTALPDLIHRPRGHMLITLFLRAFGTTEEGVKEEIISRYLSLMPLLAAYIPETEFVPVTEEKELKLRKSPFIPVHALAIHRREEDISLSTPLKRLSVGGFGPAITDICEESCPVVNHLFPWTPSLNDWSTLISTLMGQIDPVQIIVRVRAREDDEKGLSRLTDTIETCEIFLSGCKEYRVTLSKQAGMIRDVALKQLAGRGENCFDLGVFILAPHPIDNSLGNVLGRAITVLNPFNEGNSLFEGGFSFTQVRAEEALKGTYFPENSPFTLSEAACAFRLPSPPLEDQPGLPLKRSRTSLALLNGPTSIRKGSIRLVVNEHQGMTQPVMVGAEDRMRHTFIIGQTGTGKSTLMESMILQDIRAGRGLAVIDPHGEMVESILGKIPRKRAEDVILFDPLDRKRPLGFNLIQWNTIEERDLIIDELYMTLDRIYDMKSAGGPIFESNFRGMLKLLMGEKQREGFTATILEFISCYINRDFRHWLRDSIEDPQTLDFIKELERTGGEASLQNLSPYITSKFSRFTHDTTLARIVGQEKTSFDFDEIMNNGKILLINLGKGRFGATVSALLANQIVSLFKLAAMKRGDMSPEERKDFYLYVDECHNLPSENFTELLSEARKFRMGLVLATQYTAQLGASEAQQNSFLSAILGNVGTTLIFRLGQEDAGKLATALHPYFSSLDICGLPNRQGYTRMQINGEATPPFSFHTEKDTTPYSRDRASHIRSFSRLKYGNDVKDIDAQILRRRNIWKNEEE